MDRRAMAPLALSDELPEGVARAARALSTSFWNRLSSTMAPAHLALKNCWRGKRSLEIR